MKINGAIPAGHSLEVCPPRTRRWANGARWWTIEPPMGLCQRAESCPQPEYRGWARGWGDLRVCVTSVPKRKQPIQKIKELAWPIIARKPLVGAVAGLENGRKGVTLNQTYGNPSKIKRNMPGTKRTSGPIRMIVNGFLEKIFAKPKPMKVGRKLNGGRPVHEVRAPF